MLECLYWKRHVQGQKGASFRPYHIIIASSYGSYKKFIALGPSRMVTKMLVYIPALDWCKEEKRKWGGGGRWWEGLAGVCSGQKSLHCICLAKLLNSNRFLTHSKLNIRMCKLGWIYPTKQYRLIFCNSCLTVGVPSHVECSLKGCPHTSCSSR